MKKAVLVIEAQPPHIGEVLLFLHYIHEFKFLYVCINAGPLVMPIEHSVVIWQRIIKPYEKKAQLVICLNKLTDISIDGLPKIFDDCAILTTAKEVFVHLSSLDFPVQLIPTVSGYHSVFLRSAYRQGRALDWLRARAVNMVSNINDEDNNK